MSAKIGGGGGASVEELDQRLTKDEEWLSGFQGILDKSSALTGSVCSLMDNFQERIDSLSTNVQTLVAKSSVIQKEQQNIRKLLATVDATIQFHGKTTVLENTIRDGGNVLLNIDDYLEKMRNLKEAIAFFATHPVYRNHEHIKQIYEIGCANIESEFGNLVRSSCVPVDPGKIFDCLDDDYEMPSFRLASFMTLRDTQRIHKMAGWLLDNDDDAICTNFLHFYAQYRAENMMKPLRTIADQINANNRCSKTTFIKAALKKAASRIADSIDQAHRDNAIVVVLFMCSTILVLVQLETNLCSTVFQNVKTEVEVLRQIVYDPIGRVLAQSQKVVDAYEGNFAVLLPLAKFLNVGQRGLYASLQSSLFSKCVQLIKLYIDRLSNGQIGGRFVPEDGNVHPVSSGTVNFLKLLVQHQKLLVQIYQRVAEERKQHISELLGNEQTNTNSASKLFIQILTALQKNLQQKCGAYSDPHLGGLFMFNNLGYIAQCCTKDKQIYTSLQQHQPQMLSTCETEAEKVPAAIFGELGKNRRTLCRWQCRRVGGKRGTAAQSREINFYGTCQIKFLHSKAFNRDFDSIMETQKHFCLADKSAANDVRARIKQIVLRPYIEFSTRNSRECSELFESDRQLKYDAETIEMIIDMHSKKAASRIADSIDQAHRDNAIVVVLFMCSTILVLVQLETNLCSTVFQNVKTEVEVLRQIVYDPIGRVLAQSQKVVDAYEGNFAVLLPLAKFLVRHANQLAALSENVGQRGLYASLQSSLFSKCVQLIKLYIDRLSNGQIGGRFVPEDGNVHPVSSGTVNFLKLLVQHQKLLVQIYQRVAEERKQHISELLGNEQTNTNSASKLFIQILTALQKNLQQKCGAYSDPHLGGLFMFNNLGYIAQCCTKDKQIYTSLQQHQPQMLSTCETEAEKCLQQYLESWAKIGALFAAGNADGWEASGEQQRKAVKSIFTAFNRDFDSIMETQKHFCLADKSAANDVRARIKQIVLRPYIEFSTRIHYTKLYELDEISNDLKLENHLTS
uniref:Exocyst complex component 7 n=2 Tax=Globodera pallida TaxID=36090 RepID=A0A183BPK7_GLOPA